MSVAAFAAEPPVVVEKLVMGRWLGVQYRNTADKDIDAVKFRVDFEDQMGDVTKGDIFYTNTMNVKAGTHRTGYPGYTDSRNWEYSLRHSNRPHNAKLKFVPVKVKFTDGTVWEAE